MADLVKCHICDRNFGRINESHVQKHGITMVTYRSMYPNAKLVSDDVLTINSFKKKDWHSKKVLTTEDRYKLGAGNRGKKLSDDHRRKMSDSHKNRGPVSTDVREKISKSKLGKTRSSDLKHKLSEFRRGKTYNELYGIDAATRIKKQISEKSKITGFKHGNQVFKGRKHTQATKLKMRLSAIRRLNSKYSNIFAQNYNKKACRYFDMLMEDARTNIIHAENGGEFYIKSLGYWVDGYDMDNNIVYEVYEKRHFNRENVLKDKIRQEHIMHELDCKFIIVTEEDINARLG